MADIVIDRVRKSFGAVDALKAVSLDVEEGEFVSLLGPSGCGKTTLLRIVAGLESATSGDVRIGGRSVLGLEPKDRGLAMVFQNYAVFPHMTVYENVAFGLRMKRAEEARVKAQVEKAAGLLHIEPYLDRYPNKLSGGQRQRVAVARALAVEPAVLLMDEPLSNLDALLRLEIRTELKQVLAAAGTTTLYVTHDQTEAMGLSDRIAIMHDGDAVGEAHGLRLVMGDIKRRRPRRRQHLLQLRPNLQPQERVEVGERLIHQQDGRFHRQRAGHRDALPLPAGELVGIAVQIGLDMQKAGRLFHLRLHPRLLSPLHPQPEGHVFIDGHVGKDGVVLEHHGQPAVLRLQPQHAAPADAHVAGRGALQPRDDAQKRGLAAAGGAEERDEFPLLHIQRHRLQRIHGAEGFPHPVDHDIGHQTLISKTRPRSRTGIAARRR